MAEKKGGLGRGIGALIPTSDVPSERPIAVSYTHLTLPTTSRV